MFERFTDRSRRVLVLAQEEARLLAHQFIGTEHLLLGLLAEEEGMAAAALRQSGVTLRSARDAVTAIIGKGKGKKNEGSPPFTPRAKKVLEYSLRESLQRGDAEIRTEHLLLGLLREGDGVGCQVLVSMGVDLQQLWERVVVGGGESGQAQRERKPWPLARSSRDPGPWGADVPTKDVFAAYRRVLATLLRRFDLSTAEAPVGDYAELLVAGALGARLEIGTTGRRAMRVDGRQAQVRTLIADVPTTLPVDIAPVPDDVDQVVVVFLDRQDLSVVQALMVDARALARTAESPSAVLAVTDEVLRGGRDITEVVRAFQ